VIEGLSFWFFGLSFVFANGKLTQIEEFADFRLLRTRTSDYYKYNVPQVSLLIWTPHPALRATLSRKGKGRNL
jgi:hypothetical protein